MTLLYLNFIRWELFFFLAHFLFVLLIYHNISFAIPNMIPEKVVERVLLNNILNGT